MKHAVCAAVVSSDLTAHALSVTSSALLDVSSEKLAILDTFCCGSVHLCRFGMWAHAHFYYGTA